MARRQGWSRTFRRDSKLQRYFLDRVVPTGKILGTGSYGSVLEVSGVFNFASRTMLGIVKSHPVMLPSLRINGTNFSMKFKLL